MRVAEPRPHKSALEKQERRVHGASAHRNMHTRRMKEGMAARKVWYEGYGRTKDHKDFDAQKLTPKYEPPPPREDGAPSSSDPDDGWVTLEDHTTDDERNLAAEWGWDYSDDRPHVLDGDEDVEEEPSSSGQ